MSSATPTLLRQIEMQNGQMRGCNGRKPKKQESAKSGKGDREEVQGKRKKDILTPLSKTL